MKGMSGGSAPATPKAGKAEKIISTGQDMAYTAKNMMQTGKEMKLPDVMNKGHAMMNQATKMMKQGADMMCGDKTIRQVAQDARKGK